MLTVENTLIEKSRERLRKLRGVLAYCDAAHLPHRAKHVEQLIAEENVRLERLIQEDNLDPEDRRLRELRARCQHCAHHRFWGACRIHHRPLVVFGAVLMAECRCVMEVGCECMHYRPTNAARTTATTAPTTAAHGTFEHSVPQN